MEQEKKEERISKLNLKICIANSPRRKHPWLIPRKDDCSKLATFSSLLWRIQSDLREILDQDDDDGGGVVDDTVGEDDGVG